MNIRLSEDGNKIIAQFQYDPVMVSRVKSIPGARYRALDKAWVLPRQVEVVDALKMPGIVIDQDLVDWYFGWMQQANLNLEHKKHGPYTDTDFSRWKFKTQPMEHQKKGLDLCLQNNAFAIFWEMGTGKTFLMVNLLSHLKEQTRTQSLVISPLSVCSVWKNEIAKHSDNLTCEILVGSKYDRCKALNKEADVYVINYEGLRVMKDNLINFGFDNVICDESQRIKNRTSQQSKIVYELGKKADRRYILTGTPIVNNPLDAFGQMKFVNESILGSNFYAFQNRYAVMVTNGRARFPVKFVNLEELAKKIDPWCHRVTKDECLDLPEKMYETRYVELGHNARSIYKQLSTELVAELGYDLITAPIILTKLLRFSQLTAGFIKTESGEIKGVGDEKLGVLKEIIEEVAGKIVVWVKFKHELKMVCQLLDSLHVACVTLSGDTPQKEREENLRRFRDDDIRVFVSQLEAGGVGIDLTAASVAVYMSNSYSLGTRDQSESRLHRKGQVNKCTYIDVVSRGTIDEKIVNILRSKKDLAQIITGDVKRKEFIQGLVSFAD